MDTTPNNTDKTNNSNFEEMESNAGMTANSARKTKDDTTDPKPSLDIEANEKPGSKFNINDQAHSQSSKEDFVKTVSNFKHEDGTTPPSAIDSKHLSTD